MASGSGASGSFCALACLLGIHRISLPVSLELFVSHMSIEEALVFLLATEGCGMTADRLVFEINLRRLCVRRDGQPVNVSQIWAAFFKHPEMFCRDGKLIKLMV